MRTHLYKLIPLLGAFVGVIAISSLSPASVPNFSGPESFDFLLKQCSFGPRPVGSEAHSETREYLAGKLHDFADRVEIQSFRHVRDDKTYYLSNIIARFGKPDVPGVLLCAHWDTRPTADREFLESDRAKPISGADDGASGVAVLIEMAKIFHAKSPSVPVTIALFDGEDFGPTLQDMLLGAKYFATNLGRDRYRYGILLDMVGKRNLVLYRENHSDAAARGVGDKIWKTGNDLGYSSVFRDHAKYTIEDDHVPLIRAGVPCVDLIDFDYPYWHSLKDTPDKCSPESLIAVGETLLKVIYLEKP